jgi:hypothetical protein
MKAIRYQANVYVSNHRVLEKVNKQRRLLARIA